MSESIGTYKEVGGNSDDTDAVLNSRMVLSIADYPEDVIEECKEYKIDDGKFEAPFYFYPKYYNCSVDCIEERNNSKLIGRVDGDIKFLSVIPNGNIVVIPLVGDPVVFEKGNGDVYVEKKLGEGNNFISSYCTFPSGEIIAVEGVPRVGNGYVMREEDMNVVIWEKDEKGSYRKDLVKKGKSITGVQGLPNNEITISSINRNRIIEKLRRNSSGSWESSKLGETFSSSLSSYFIRPNKEILMQGGGRMGFLVKGYDYGFSLNNGGFYENHQYKDSNISSFQVLPDGNVVTIDGNNNLIYWKINRTLWKYGKTLIAHKEFDYFSSLQVMPNGDILTGTRSGDIELWKMGSEGSYESNKIATTNNIINSFQMLPNGNIFVAGDNGKILLLK